MVCCDLLTVAICSLVVVLVDDGLMSSRTAEAFGGLVFCLDAGSLEAKLIGAGTGASLAPRPKTVFGHDLFSIDARA